MELWKRTQLLVTVCLYIRILLAATVHSIFLFSSLAGQRARHTLSVSWPLHWFRSSLNVSRLAVSQLPVGISSWRCGEVRWLPFCSGLHGLSAMWHEVSLVTDSRTSYTLRMERKRFQITCLSISRPVLSTSLTFGLSVCIEY